VSAAPGAAGRLKASAAVALLAAGAGAFAWMHGAASPGAPRALAERTERSVTVRVALERDARGNVVLAGTFTPERAGFHLYGKDLPAGGIQGIGRPTRLEVGPAGALRAAGALTADRAEETLDAPLVGLKFPVYPAGPVTLRQPVAVAGGDSADVSVTYMACSEQVCLPPVIGRRIRVPVPRT
jgi:hypothetical protein